MPLFRPAPASSPADLPDAFDLSTPEEIRSRKRRRLLIVSLTTLVLLAIAGFFGARPAAHAIKGWQARRAAAQAETLIDAESWREAQEKVQDACQFRPGEPAALRAAARFLTRVGHSAEAAAFLKELEAARPLRPDELRDYAAVELNLGNLDAAATRLRQAWPTGTEGAPADWRIGMQLAARRQQPSDTLALARKIANSAAASDRQKLEAIQLQLAVGSADDQTAGWAAVQKLANGKSAESLDALVLLCRQTGAALNAAKAGKAPAGPPPASAAELGARLEAHPLARIQHRLLALDLRLAEDPSKSAEVIQSAIQRFAGGDPEELAGLGAWLYSKGELAKVLEVIPESKAILSRALYLQYLDTLGALGRWSEIADLIQQQRFTLEPMTEHMYLARCNEQLGKTQARDLHWNAAVASAGASPEKLLAVGNYAARNAALGPAEVAFRAAIQAAPESRPAYAALLELLQRESRTASIHELLQLMATRWPLDDAVRNDAAYTALLLGEGDPAPAREIARELVRKAPGSLPHRVTLALAELRMGHALSAMDAFQGIDFAGVQSQPRQLAVYAAALWETSNEADARKAVARIPVDRLLPEEQTLISKITL